jgi:hypothetical protein
LDLEGLLSLRGEAFIRAAYVVFLGREADQGGVQFYARRLREGYGKASVIRDLAASKEARGRTAGPLDHLPAKAPILDMAALSKLTDDAFITKLFQELLGRTPESAAREHYRSFLKQGGTRQRVVKDIEASAEARERSARDRNFANDLARLLRQEDGTRGWRAWLSRGERIERRLRILEDRTENAADEIYSRLEALFAQSPSSRAARLPDRTPPPADQVADLSVSAARHYRRLRRANATHFGEGH